MIGSVVTKARMFLRSSCMEAKQVRADGRQFSKVRGVAVKDSSSTSSAENETATISSKLSLGYSNNEDEDDDGMNNKRDDIEELGWSSTTSYWSPHPYSGIYVPKGHEWVVDDVPKNAASFGQTYWLRNVDGVDKADPDLSSDHYFHFHAHST
ncbi:uncharacterized protein LOC133814812 [Humulus lupulus]|uniref:uncharacterized protein LOC133814812 n=1 Tax=Humulus lupulus TaxID=3486 RepID=UPI002B40FF3D|nr:uncharacterized protein LOC133814812 [Humulus lupulus]